MKLNEIDDLCLSKYKSCKELFTKSRTMITQYVSVASGTVTLFFNQLLTLFNDNSSQVQVLLEPKYFAILSITCGALTILFKFLDERKRIIESKRLIKEKELEELRKLEKGIQ